MRTESNLHRVLRNNADTLGNAAGCIVLIALGMLIGWSI